MTSMKQYDDDVAMQASQWIARLNSGQFSGEDEAALRLWLDESERHRQEYHAQIVLWQELGGFEAEFAAMADAPATVPESPDRPAASKLVDLPIGKAWRRLSVAASGLIAASLFAGFLIFSGSDVPVSGPQRYMTQKGHQTEALLADNTRILMNTDSNLVVEYKYEERHVALERGEAFFDVASDPERPFVVETEWGNVRVLGTQFNVMSSADGLRVDVLEGLVEIVPRADLLAVDTEVRLTANQSLVVANMEQDGAVIARETVAEIAPWRDGILTFSNQTLAEVIEEINRYTRRQIIIASPALEAMPVSGSFNIGDLAAFLEGLEAILPIEARRRDGAILLVQSDD